MKLNSLDKTHEKVLHKSMSTTIESTRIVTKCSVQEGVRMMVTPSMFMSGQSTIEKAVLSPPVNVQRAVVVTQDAATTSKTVIGVDQRAKIKEIAETESAGKGSSSALATMIAETSTSVAKQIAVGVTSKQNGSNWTEQANMSPIPRTLGRQKRIVEPSITPATTPISLTSIISIDETKSFSGKTVQPVLNTFDKVHEFGSPDSPMSKMNVMPNPLPNISHGSLDLLLSPKRY